MQSSTTIQVAAGPAPSVVELNEVIAEGQVEFEEAQKQGRKGADDRNPPQCNKIDDTTTTHDKVVPMTSSFLVNTGDNVESSLPTSPIGISNGNDDIAEEATPKVNPYNENQATEASSNVGEKKATETRDDEDEKTEETSAWFLQRLFFSFASKLFFDNLRASRKNEHHRLEANDFWRISKVDHVEEVTKRFEKEYSDPRNGLRWSLFRLTKREMLLAGGLRTFVSALMVANPLLLQQLLLELQSPNPNFGEAYGWACGLGAAMFFKCTFENMSLWLTSRAGWQMRSAVCSAVYRKSLRLSNASRQSKTLGEIVNYMQLDAHKIGLCTDQVHALWDAPVQVMAFTVVLWFILGWPTFVGLAVTLMSIPIMSLAVMRLAKLDRRAMLASDDRVKSTNEAIQSMLGVKVSCWEDALLGVVERIRALEVSFLYSNVYMRAIMSSLMASTPAFASVCAMTAFALAANGAITPATLFSALQAFSFLRNPLMLLPLAMAQTAQANVSVRRVEGFLQLDEIEQLERGQVEEEEEGFDVVIKDATFSWVRKTGGIPSGQISLSMNHPTAEESSFTANHQSSQTPMESSLPVNPKHQQQQAQTPMESSSTANTLLLDPKQQLQPSSSSLSNLLHSSRPGSSSTTMNLLQTTLNRPVLKNINLKIRKGELIAVVGRVGSGKSALLNAILGEIHLLEGTISVASPVCAYAAQSPWILNATVRDNILFGAPFERERYERVVETCQLQRDLELFPEGDQTEIGERGVSLSGGQRQRIATARAAYWAKFANGFVILDDVLSALDPEVGAKLFTECVCEFLEGTTRIIVTNQLENIDRFDRVVLIDHNTVADVGTFEELIAKDNVFAKLLTRFVGGSAASSATSLLSMKQLNHHQKKKNTNKRFDSLSGGAVRGMGTSTALMQVEEREIGAVKASVYKTYILAGGGYALAGFVLFWFLFLQGAFFINAIWVTWWTNDAVLGYPNPSKQLSFYLIGYFLTAVVLLMSGFVRTFAIYWFGIRATTALQKSAFIAVLHGKMEFFETTPTGRILQRFSRDVRDLDADLPENLQMFLFTFFFVLWSILTVAVITPIFIAFVIPFLIVLYVVLYIYRPVMRDAKRLGAIALSPVYAQFSETLGGLSSVRAFGVVDRFVSKESRQIDQATRLSLYAQKLCERWIGLRVEFFGAAIVLVACCLAVQSVSSGNLTAGTAGLSITYATLISSMASILVRSFAVVEASMNSVERVSHFRDHIPQEKWRDEDYQDDPEYHQKAALPDTWPEGKITVENLSLKYRSNTPLVLQHVSFEIAAREKIGIVGRSGSGKSSLFVAILRIVEPVEGSRVLFDDVDVSHVRLDQVRSRIGVAPQFPVLFSGTVRYNIDPFQQFDDAAIWAALEGVGLKQSIESLDAKVAESGENFSQGERQLLSLSRLLLRRPKVVLLDEATASVDTEGDEMVQRSIRETFKDSTMLVIAHRLRTIIMSDRILVLAPGGTVAEFDTPQVLLSNPQSQLSLAVAEMGEKQAEMIRAESFNLTKALL